MSAAKRAVGDAPDQAAAGSACIVPNIVPASSRNRPYTVPRVSLRHMQGLSPGAEDRLRLLPRDDDSAAEGRC